MVVLLKSDPYEKKIGQLKTTFQNRQQYFEKHQEKLLDDLQRISKAATQTSAELRSLKDQRSEFQYMLREHYINMLQNDESVSDKSLVWIIKALWRIGEEAYQTIFPNYLDSNNIQFLMRLAKLESRRDQIALDYDQELQQQQQLPKQSPREEDSSRYYGQDRRMTSQNHYQSTEERNNNNNLNKGRNYNQGGEDDGNYNQNNIGEGGGGKRLQMLLQMQQKYNLGSTREQINRKKQELYQMGGDSKVIYAEDQGKMPHNVVRWEDSSFQGKKEGKKHIMTMKRLSSPALAGSDDDEVQNNLSDSIHQKRSDSINAQVNHLNQQIKDLKRAEFERIFKQKNQENDEAIDSLKKVFKALYGTQEANHWMTEFLRMREELLKKIEKNKTFTFKQAVFGPGKQFGEKKFDPATIKAQDLMNKQSQLKKLQGSGQSLQPKQFTQELLENNQSLDKKNNYTANNSSTYRGSNRQLPPDVLNKFHMISDAIMQNDQQQALQQQQQIGSYISTKSNLNTLIRSSNNSFFTSNNNNNNNISNENQQFGQQQSQQQQMVASQRPSTNNNNNHRKMYSSVYSNNNNCFTATTTTGTTTNSNPYLQLDMFTLFTSDSKNKQIINQSNKIKYPSGCFTSKHNYELETATAASPKAEQFSLQNSKKVNFKNEEKIREFQEDNR